MNKYEALGRYIEAKEEFEKLKQRRSVFVDKIAETTPHLQAQSCKSIQKVALELNEMLHQLTQINEEAITLLENVNEYAEICGRPKVN